MSGYAEGSLWFYVPNKGAPVAFAVIFLLSGSIHVWQCFRYKSWKITGLLPWAALLFVAGFIMREVGAYDYKNTGIYIASTVLLLCAPPVYEGANFFILRRILHYVPYHSPLHPTRVITTFLNLDAVIGVLTAVGAAKFAGNSIGTLSHHLCQSLMKAALLLQIASMALFVGVAAKFHRNCRRGGVCNQKLKSVFVVLYCSCSIITVRTIYRTAEYFASASVSVRNTQSSSHTRSPIFRHEWFFWVFEASLMLGNSILLNVFYPLRHIPSSDKIYLSRDGVTEIEGQGFADKGERKPRPLIVALLDPLDIVGLIRGKDKETGQWEMQEEMAVETVPSRTVD